MVNNKRDGHMKICMFGASSDRIKREYLDAARDFGRAVAGAGHELWFGGGAHGVMGEAARGAAEAGGVIVGVAPSFFNTGDVLYKSCTRFIYTDTMRKRKAELEAGADAFAVLPGGIGTYEEFFEVLVLCQLGQMHKPIAVYNIDGCYDAMYALLENTVSEGFMDAANLTLCRFCTSAAEVMEYFEEYYK